MFCVKYKKEEEYYNIPSSIKNFIKTKNKKVKRKTYKFFL